MLREDEKILKTVTKQFFNTESKKKDKISKKAGLIGGVDSPDQWVPYTDVYKRNVKRMLSKKK